MLALVAVSALIQVDPYLLKLGVQGQVSVSVNQTIRTRDGVKAGLDDIVAEARSHRFIYLGESHDNGDHHKMQAEVIRALASSGRPVVVGLEMFTRPNQPNLNGWTLGWYTEQEFIEKADWKKQWGFDYNLYKPIFDAVKEYRLPMVALNVPREWVRVASREGFDKLPEDARKQLPPQDYGNKAHRSIFDALVGGHAGGSMDGMYRGQVLWDEGMADSALRYMDAYPRASNPIMAIVAGSGHVMYGEGINYRIRKRTGEAGVTVVMIDGEQPRTVSRGLADFVYMAPAPPRK